MTQIKQVPTPLASSQPNDEVYTTEDAARILKCGKQSLLRKFRSGEIPAKKKRKRWYTTHSNLLSYVNS
ncbi:helix-turn-helix domain-containing protein [Rhodocytophaga aerolata]|uniref:Helix-turn-helix domain-containing protein n=1 Tax=Rhodocytophaga aerolata TaxID=455078 RepID=A0ABT8R2X5_9BACT|nr:helix-turn-helix domain-containing protein [Rhodocytophaga aerolata]MDO1446284.1 helix-turn-helix domain-containing protein [Rhodocytophaga aerolata]